MIELQWDYEQWHSVDGAVEPIETVHQIGMMHLNLAEFKKSDSWG